jgi:hypothetical protein
MWGLAKQTTHRKSQAKRQVIYMIHRDQLWGSYVIFNFFIQVVEVWGVSKPSTETASRIPHSYARLLALSGSARQNIGLGQNDTIKLAPRCLHVSDKRHKRNIVEFIGSLGAFTWLGLRMRIARKATYLLPRLLGAYRWLLVHSCNIRLYSLYYSLTLSLISNNLVV